MPHTPTSKRYFEQRFTEHKLDWKVIYLLSCKVTLDSYSCSFQYESLHNIIFLNKKLLTFGNSNPPLYSFYKLYDETVSYIFFECIITQNLWKQLSSYLEEHLQCRNFH